MVQVVMSPLKGWIASLGSLTRATGAVGPLGGSGLALRSGVLPAVTGVQCLSMFTVAA